MILNLYKKRGETPLQTIEKFKNSNIEGFGDLNNTPMTYLGRLDPMADGVLLVGVEADTSEEVRQKYMGLDKEYDFTVLFGFSTDTYDCLGIVANEDREITQIAEDEARKSQFDIDIRRVTQIYKGERMQKLPKFSSKVLATFDIDTVREGEIKEEELPENKITIYDLGFSGFDTLSAKELFGRLLSDIGKVRGDFRQIKILGEWKERLVEKDTERKYLLGKFHAHVSSGTYIRSLVHDMASTLGTKALALSITRTRQGEYDINDSIRF